ncbi:outer membrane protein assembly factor [Dyadobacter sp. CY261]|uniref:BamA/TamA family outer membrane protein n=1 Tax=Dyadobacter sp. CY261 TaxID=2907203 RepID=UPI001F3EACFD|nr:BamA/TamA family outer membrane protein [Dyadobacter sp. CY261]MCF0069036.1 outer membrane protein assembly factor [Dyadobacter sp. CY261]
MQRLSVSVALLLLAAFSVYAAEFKVILTGNTAEFENAADIFPIIENYLTTKPGPLLWVFNGDSFPEQMTIEQVTEWKKKANELLERNPELHIIMNQGDRDWLDSGKDGWKRVLALEKALDQEKHARFQLFFGHGCPGPWTVSFPTLEVVVINSQWWNHPYEKPKPSSDICTIADTDNFIEELEGILDETSDKNVLLLSHFPIESLGNFGGRFSAVSYLAPPLVGSAIVGFRQNIGTSHDISNVNLGLFRYKLSGVLQDYGSMILASGHENNQSIVRKDNNYFINSGSIADGRYVARSKKATLTSSSAGLVEIIYSDNGEIRYQQWNIEGNQLVKKENGQLFASACQTNAGSLMNTLFQPCNPVIKPSEKMEAPHPDPATVAAGSEYGSRRFKEKWFGKHYRDSWTQPVKVPYLDMDTTFGGLVIGGKGGGRQTTSLKLIAGNGKEYVFRSVDKDPFRALAYELRGTVVSQVLKDQTSTQQPYGAMAVAPLLDKIGILHATPELYVLPKDKKLGSFETKYGNLFGMLEERPTDKLEKPKIFAGAKDIEKSFKLFNKLYHDHDNRVDKYEFARARMFDLWIGDWSKHEDNWKWAGYKTADGELYRPIPRDRDHAFSRWDGIIPWLADREWGVPNGENFGERIQGLRSLMWQARHLDRFVGSELTKADWVRAAKEIQDAISEKDITAAVHNMPEEIYSKDGQVIERKLKIRIGDLRQYAAEYYALLAKEVDVVGSNKAEYFKITREPNGQVRVGVYAVSKQNRLPDSSKIYYQRTFDPAETREIRLNGLGGDDVFDVEGKADRSILVRIISGDGNDHVSDQSEVAKGGKQTLVYEKDRNPDHQLGTEAREIKPADGRFYEYDRNAFKYNTYLPIALLTYNPFVGFAVHGGVTFTRQRFGKPDFASKHSLSASVSVKGNYDFTYANQFRYLAGKWDGISQITVSRPLNYNFFFGVGNDTPKNDDLDSDYYRTQYNSFLVSAGLLRQFWKQSKIEVTASYELDEGIRRNSSYLADHPDVFGVEQLHLIFAKGILNLDFRDRTALPERGFRIQLTQQAGHVSQSKNDLASISELELEQYLSTHNKNPLTLGLRLGGGIAKGKLPFYKLFSLGQLNDLRGFKRNRFTGESKGFLNTELRWQLTETQNTFIPLKMGVRAFYDVGRVWAKNDPDNADYWHQGYGGGFYITPFREQFAFNISAGTSREESLLLMISIGSFFK